MKSFKKYVYIGLPVLGILFYLYYLHIATIDMIYSDYIRLINSYLPDVWNPEKFFVADLLTRIPINYLVRGINVTVFGYSVTFERVLGVLSFGASALVLGSYCRKQRIGLGWYALIMVFMFSLNKWEMICNSTGWVHFLAFACFFYHYTVLDRVYRNHGTKHDLIRLTVLPAIITIFVAGPYCAIYSMTLIIACGFIWIQNRYQAYLESRNTGGGDRETKKAKRSGIMSAIFGGERCRITDKQMAILIVSVIWPLLLYIWSDSKAVYEHSGAVEASIVGTFFQQPEFFLKFLLKSFASIVFGVELISEHMKDMPDMFLYLTGFGVLASYFIALWMNFHYEIYKKTIFPLMLLAGGGMNHLVVMVSRWIFLKDTYGMSSRYALQFQVGILGILLTFALVWKKLRAEKDERTEQTREGKCIEEQVSRRKKKRGQKQSRNPWLDMTVKIIALAVTAVVLMGNLATTKAELAKAPYRKLHSLEVKEILLDFENQDDEVLKQKLEYSKPGKKEALRILKENGWNIFKGEQ